jgi:putative addiction module component (TIGR02574 family)
MSILIVPLLSPDLILRISIKISSFSVSTERPAGPSAGEEVDRETELFQLATEIRRISLTPVISDPGRLHERITPWNPGVLAQLLRLPPGDRADLAMALWESLSDDEREGELALSPEQRAELDRRWAEYEKRPDNVVPWSDVRRKLLARE